MSLRRVLLGVMSIALPIVLAAQGLDQATLLKQPTDAFVQPAHTFPVVEIIECNGRSFRPNPFLAARLGDLENC